MSGYKNVSALPVAALASDAIVSMGGKKWKAPGKSTLTWK